MADLPARREKHGMTRWEPLRELEEVRERTGVLCRRTRRVGEFDYRVALAGELDAEGIDAQLKEGVLSVRVPKPARAQSRRIEINSG